jgi:8-oxo-dGTP diphosphatase
VDFKPRLVSTNRSVEFPKIPCDWFSQLTGVLSKIREAPTLKRGIDYIGVGVGAIIVNERGELFLAQRGPLAKNERGLWEFPGGSVEFGETLANALRREIREEYGMEIEVGALLDVVDHILPAEGQHWVSPTYVCKPLSDEPRILEPGKCTGIGWFRVEDVPGELTVISRHNLANFIELQKST